MIARLTDPNHSTLTMLIGICLPLFAGLLVIAPPVAVVLGIVVVVYARRRSSRIRQERAAARAAHKATWGF